MLWKVSSDFSQFTSQKKKMPQKSLDLFLFSCCLCFCLSQSLHPTSCVHVLLYVVRIHCLKKLEWFDKTREFILAMTGTHWAQTMSQGLCPRAPLVTARSVTRKLCAIFCQTFGTAAKRKWQSYLPPFLSEHLCTHIMIWNKKVIKASSSLGLSLFWPQSSSLCSSSGCCSQSREEWLWHGDPTCLRIVLNCLEVLVELQCWRQNSSPLLNACAGAGSVCKGRQILTTHCISHHPSKCYPETSVILNEFQMRLDLVGAAFFLN